MKKVTSHFETSLKRKQTYSPRHLMTIIQLNVGNDGIMNTSATRFGTTDFKARHITGCCIMPQGNKKFADRFKTLGAIC